MRWLSLRGNDFIACWAFEETIPLHTKSTLNEFSRVISQRSDFDSFYMDIQKHAEPTRKRFHRLLSIRGNDFIACWAYEDTILSLAEHTWKRFYRLLSQRRNGVHCMMVNLSRLRSGRLVYGGGDSSTEGGLIYGVEDLSTLYRGETRLWRGRFVFGGGNSFFLMSEQVCWKLSSCDCE
jgi:hypothetical protein